MDGHFLGSYQYNNNKDKIKSEKTLTSIYQIPKVEEKNKYYKK